MRLPFLIVGFLALCVATLRAEDQESPAAGSSPSPEANEPATKSPPTGESSAAESPSPNEQPAPGHDVAPSGEPNAASSHAPPERSPIQFDLGSPVGELEKALGFAVDGSISGRYRFRSSPGDQRDQDLYQNFYLRVGKPEVNPLSAVFLGRLSEDIDGHPRDGGFGVYNDVSDTYSSNVNGRFYLGYLDVRRLKVLDSLGLEQVRAGRQTYDETADTLTFDGGRIDTRAFESLAGLRLTVYGGLPTHYYESSPSGDAVAGGGLELSPARRTRLRVDYTYLQDRQETFHARDHLLSAALWQSWENGLGFHGRYNLLGDETRDYFVRGDYRSAEHDLFLQASFRHLVTTMRDLSLEIDRYYEIIREYRPYWQVTARASKGLGDSFVVDGGVDIRQLVHEADSGLYNHEFTRYYLVPATRDWPVSGMSISLTGEYWDSDGADVFNGGGEIRQKLLKALEVSAGSYYSLYKLNRFSEDEKTRVRTYFGRINYNLATNLLLNVLYEYEKDDFTNYHTLETSITYTF